MILLKIPVSVSSSVPDIKVLFHGNLHMISLERRLFCLWIFYKYMQRKIGQNRKEWYDYMKSVDLFGSMPPQRSLSGSVGCDDPLLQQILWQSIIRI